MATSSKGVKIAWPKMNNADSKHQALIILKYCLEEGSERFEEYCRTNLAMLESLVGDALYFSRLL